MTETQGNSTDADKFSSAKSSGPWQDLRQRLMRGLWLKETEWGRAAGWWIELEGRRVGRLTAPHVEDMFWMSYELAEASQTK